MGAPLCVGALAGLGRPGIEWTPLFFVGELTLAYLASSAPRLVQAGLIGASFGLGLFSFIALGSLSWGVTVPASLVLIGVALYALPLALCCWGLPRLFSGVALFFATVAAWSLCLDVGDALKFPLKEAAQSLVISAPLLAAGARLVGSNVLSGILLATELLVARALARRRSEGIAVRAAGALPALAAGVGVLALLGSVAQVTAPAPGRSVEVGVPQINTGAEYYASRLLRPELARVFDQTFERLLADLAGAELVVTTEGFDGRFGLSLPLVRARWQAEAKRRDQALAVTSYTVEHGFKGNAVAGFDRRGEVVGVHRKVDLALEGEKMLVAGAGYEVFRFDRDLRVGVPLCIESLLTRAPFAMTRAGATLLAASTSDLSFGSNVTAFEHLATTALRAIETGRAIVWASNGGPSGVIDRWGNFEIGAPFRVTRATRVRAALHADTTPYLSCAPVVTALCVVLLLALTSVALFGRRRVPDADVDARLFVATQTPLAAAVATALAFFGSAALVLSGPALVELTHGVPARALGAVRETLRPPRFSVPPAAFARFRTAADRTAPGAIAYFLTYYGIETSNESLPPGLPATPSLADVQAYLTEHFELPTERIAVEPGRLPRVAAIVRGRDGAFGVVSDPAGDGHPLVFGPALATSVPVSPRALSNAASHVALVPR
ncbi:MAG TPA: nitrilase-related carbon-nitrogen hydrolase [Polyangiaceae bacterium]|nr:nitrilase-related carbon-nitrogen hydrolase [Polyangiaceae bacterium]